MTQEEKTKLIAEIEKLKAGAIKMLREEEMGSPMYFSACGQASAFVAVINLIEEQYDTRRI